MATVNRVGEANIGEAQSQDPTPDPSLRTLSQKIVAAAVIVLICVASYYLLPPKIAALICAVGVVSVVANFFCDGNEGASKGCLYTALLVVPVVIDRIFSSRMCNRVIIQQNRPPQNQPQNASPPRPSAPERKDLLERKRERSDSDGDGKWDLDSSSGDDEPSSVPHRTYRHERYEHKGYFQ